MKVALSYVWVVLAALLKAVEASSFLGKSEPIDKDMSLSTEQRLFDVLERELGGEGRIFTGMRLRHIKEALQPLFKAMPKNAAGRLDLPAVNYVLRRTLLDRHAWFVKSLEPESKSWAAWGQSDPMHILRQHLSENVTSAFESRFKEGLDMNEIALLAASLEHLVHKESYDRLAVSYRARSLSMADVVSREEVTELLDQYMALYLRGHRLGNISMVTAETAKHTRQVIEELYPTWPENQQFVRDVLASTMPSRDHFYMAEILSVVDQMQDRYGRWSNKDCSVLKGHLLDIEDQRVGGAGRVRLADFYNAALTKGRWEFLETPDSLRFVGAMDETDPADPKVIIPNYINNPTNCVASSSYYQVCCIDECDSLLGHLEKAFGSPESTPEEILAVVSALPSSTLAANRTLAPWLVQRLHDISDYHEGSVPLHGRLFSQWMHYAYPRECTYPHQLGDTNLTYEASRMEVDELREFLRWHKPSVFSTSGSDADPEVDEELQCTMWSMNEELVVERRSTPQANSPGNAFDIDALLRCVMILLLVGSFSKMLKDLVSSAPSKMKDAGSTEKFYV